MIPRRTTRAGFGGFVTEKTAMEQSAVWAAIRLRADLVSTMPVDVYRYASINDGPPMQIEAAPTPFVASPGFMEFLYSTQVELDRTGNAIGIIRQVNGAGLPVVIDLQASSACDVIIRDNQIFKYRISGVEYDPSEIWHEKQFTAPGLHVGMSPVAYAAFTLGQFRTVQEFATTWFQSGNGPRASLKNTEKKLSGKESTLIKEAWRASQTAGEPFVHGADWEYSLIQADQASADWIEAQKLTLPEIARFFGVPADLIDAAVQGGPSITYANITQRNLQFLIMHLGPAIIRRENAISAGMLPRPRFIKLNSDALLRMDPMTRAQTILMQIQSRVLAPSEARSLDNRQPYTPEQIAEFDELGLNPRATTPATSLTPQAGPDPFKPDSPPAPAGAPADTTQGN
jgi:HK97 family phage portal protein